MTDRTYQVTFIINLRQTKRKIDELTEFLKSVLKEVGASTTKVEDLGMKDFVRVTEKENPTGHYLRFSVSASGDFSNALSARLRLEKEIKRSFVESVAPVK